MNRFLAVVVLSLGLCLPLRAEPELFTNAYVVPPTFLASEAKVAARPTAKAKLEEAGITFPEGTSAIYNAASSQLIVRNTHDQMELVEAYVESIVQHVEKQIYVSVYEVRFQGEFSELLKSRKSTSNFGGPELDGELSRLFDFPEPETGKGRVYHFDSEKSFQAELSRPPKPIEDTRDARRTGMTGTLTDPQFQVVMRALSQIPGVDIENPPSVMVRSGQPGMTQKEERRYGFVTVIGADEFTIDLALFLPEEGKALFDEGTELEPTAKVTIWDGQTMVIADKNENGENRLVFVKAQFMDPAGLPIRGRLVPASQKEEAVELPTTEKKESRDKNP